jgi:hypothetical protein
VGAELFLGPGDWHLSDCMDKFSMKRKRTLADIKSLVMRRLRPWPFSIAVTSLWPGTNLAYAPDHCSENLAEYQREPGLRSSIDPRSFYAGNRTNADKPERPILIPDKSGTAAVRKTVS